MSSRLLGEGIIISVLPGCWPCFLTCLCLFLPYQHLFFLPLWMELEGGDFQAFIFKSPGNWTVEFASQQWPPERQPLYCQSPVIFSCHLQILDYCIRIVSSHNYSNWLALSDELGCILFFFSDAMEAEEKPGSTSAGKSAEVVSVVSKNMPCLIVLMC